METQEEQLQSVPARVIAWTFAALSVMLCAKAALNLRRSTVINIILFQGHDLELPAATKFFLSNYAWFYPLLFGGLAFFLILKELLIQSPRRRMVATGMLLVLAVAASVFVRHSIDVPLAEMIQKMKQTR